MKTSKCESCSKVFELETNNFNNVIIRYYLPKHYDNVGRQCGDSFRQIDREVKLLSLRELMSMPIEDIARYTGFICNDAILKAEITSLWEPELKLWRSLSEENNES